jgi:hypothetical protein
MDRLQSNESIRIDQELQSNNGLFRLRMVNTGGLELYRVQTGPGLPIWKSVSQPHVGAYATMQPDGNFVIRWPQGAAYWSTQTQGHPGAFVVMQDDGNLVVYDTANRALWASQSAQDMHAPTIRYKGEGGFTYNETSESWKQLCTMFPCFMALQWPGYATTIVEDVIDGQAVVIQLWKGLCPKFLGMLGVQYFPGGVGAEVGIYRRIPGKLAPTALPGLPDPLAQKILSGLRNLADTEFWWPFPELGATLECSFINPLTGETVFSGGPQKGYWLTKWMDENDYATYRQTHATPGYTDYILDFHVNGKHYRRWPGRPLSSQAATELLLLS